MFIRVERGSSLPLSKQIDEQIRAQCLSGALKAGTCLPSVRQLAKELAVNANTVVRVYERLSAEGFLDMRQGDGTYVLDRDKPTGVSDLIQRREQFTREFDATVRAGLLLGLTPADLRKQLSTAVMSFRGDVKEYDKRGES